MGLVNLAFQSMANASVQLATDPRLRGRVMGLYMLAFIGGTLIGAPPIGALTIQFGARVGMTVCGAVPALAAVVVAAAAARRRRAGGVPSRVPSRVPQACRPTTSGPALRGDLQFAELADHQVESALSVRPGKRPGTSGLGIALTAWRS
jgi:MFS family permease